MPCPVDTCFCHDDPSQHGVRRVADVPQTWGLEANACHLTSSLRALMQTIHRHHYFRETAQESECAE